ncbi:tryptophan 7-halogenase [Marinimicrobium sp. C6131]|uniref:tryptophan halogenase family protein n=1 Tax=Marinimicrobium sp. C6131 TaxID=3022676 RepID=UPI00223CFF7F|nr:tryptophan halogenase family protein [Marinimicrobium sp. C6131]UZJ45735.1 tryptophan 7-halogenase [Marinimicrobium sp. C6131]
MINDPIQRVVILGGGTAGWMAAAMMAERYRDRNLHIELVESPDVPTVGVGEATVPGLRQLHRNLRVSEAEFIRATGATFKLGIEFENWRCQGHKFFHPFADFGTKIAGQSFYHCWVKQRLEGRGSSLDHYSVAVQMARAGRFSQPDIDATSPLARYNYAYHFDASLYARFLQAYAEARGVVHRRANVAAVELNSDNGYVQALTLKEGGRISGDLFIDCSGFRSLILGQTLGVPFDSWADMLPCDRAVVVQTENTEGLTPYTRSIAREAGWQWRIPLEQRCGNGYVYSSRYIDDEQAERDLLSSLREAPITEPRKLSFEAGMRRDFWRHNCVALGLASGFIEPLESTSISLIQTGMEKLMQFIPDLRIQPENIDEANRLNQQEYERVRDFILLHYIASDRSDTPFWRSFRDRPVPEPLREKMANYDRDGSLVLHEQESFHEANWMAMYNGFGRLPGQCPPSVVSLDADKLEQVMIRMKELVAEAASCAPSHSEFLAQVYDSA